MADKIKFFPERKRFLSREIEEELSLVEQSMRKWCGICLQKPDGSRESYQDSIRLNRRFVAFKNMDGYILNLSLPEIWQNGEAYPLDMKKQKRRNPPCGM